MSTGYVANQTTVYYGPSSTLYPSNNSYVGPNENVDVLWREGNWYYIEYQSGNYRKRMYAPISSVTGISTSVPSPSFTYLTRYVGYGGATYNGPNSVDYASAGSVENYERVTFIDGTREGNYALIEYDISGTNQKKRAWFIYNELGSKLGVDTYAKITSQAQANAIKNAGYSFVGRYYYDDSNTHFDLSEASYLSNAGLDVFIYYQNGASGSINYFTPSKGVSDASSAYRIARSVNQPQNTMIYFAVEVDATLSQVNGPIKAYFDALTQKMAELGTANNHKYGVGVYRSGFLCENLNCLSVVTHTVAGAWTGCATYHDWDNRQFSPITIAGTAYDVVVSKLAHAGGWTP